VNFEPAATPGRGWIGALLLGTVTGVPVSIAAGWVAFRVINEAWYVCDDAEPPYLFGLILFILPMIVVGIFVAWIFAALLTRNRSVRAFLLVGLIAVALAGYSAVYINVPAHDPSFYAGEIQGPGNECLPNGQPTWWPGWLPFPG
jgi:hypothetical protein